MNTKHSEDLNSKLKSTRLENTREEVQSKLRVASISFALGIVGMAVVGVCHSESRLALFVIWAALLIFEAIQLIVCIGLASTNRQLSEAYCESARVKLSVQNCCTSSPYNTQFYSLYGAWVRSASDELDCIYVDGFKHRKLFAEGSSGEAEVFRSSSDDRVIAIDFMGKVFFGRGADRNLVNWIVPAVAIILVVVLKSIVG